LGDQGFSGKELELLEIGEDGKITVYDYPVIPEGFVASSVTTEDDVIEGLVIYEGTQAVTETNHPTAMTSRNQYVWIPVPDMSEFVRREGYESYAPQTFGTSEYISEPFDGTSSDGITLSATNDLTGEYAEYAKMRASVEKYGGFYIARYEAGTTTARGEVDGGTSFKADGTTPDVVSQKDKPVYNYVGWGSSMVDITGNVEYSDKGNQGKGAVYLSRSVYPESANKEVVSTLIYGVQWDAVMNFMKDVKNPNGTRSDYFIYESTGMGWDCYNYSSTNSTHKTGIDVGNALNMVKNIYDLAGNVREWTMEGYMTDERFVRGGSFGESAGAFPMSYRINNVIICLHESVGFRVALYIK